MRATAKGQVIIPLAIRRNLHITLASEVDFVLDDAGRGYLVKGEDGDADRRFAALRKSATVKMTTDGTTALTRNGL